MVCEKCAHTFAVEGRDRAEHIDQTHANCRCERGSVSPHSPGPIADPEILIRIIVAPQHVTKKGELKAGSLSQAENSGLSIFREHMATDAEIVQVATVLVARARQANCKGAGVAGVLRMECRAVRQAKADAESDGGFCVYDTALSDNQSHGEIFQRVHGNESLLEDRRKNLFNAVKQTFVTVDQFRQGLLLPLALPK